MLRLLRRVKTYSFDQRLVYIHIHKSQSIITNFLEITSKIRRQYSHNESAKEKTTINARCDGIQENIENFS